MHTQQRTRPPSRKASEGVKIASSSVKSGRKQTSASPPPREASVSNQEKKPRQKKDFMKLIQSVETSDVESDIESNQGQSRGIVSSTPHHNDASARSSARIPATDTTKQKRTISQSQQSSRSSSPSLSSGASSSSSSSKSPSAVSAASSSSATSSAANTSRLSTSTTEKPIKMIWSPEMDLALIREVLNKKPHLASHGATGKTWDQVADTLSRVSCFASVSSLVKGRNSQEHFENLKNKRMSHKIVLPYAEEKEEKLVEELLDKYLQEIDNKKLHAQEKKEEKEKVEELKQEAKEKRDDAAIILMQRKKEEVLESEEDNNSQQQPSLPKTNPRKKRKTSSGHVQNQAFTSIINLSNAMMETEKLRQRVLKRKLHLVDQSESEHDEDAVSADEAE